MAEMTQAQKEAAEGWAVIDQRFLRWHDRMCATHTFKANRPVCDCGLQDRLDAERARTAVLERALRNLIADAYAHNPKDATGSIREARAALATPAEGAGE